MQDKASICSTTKPGQSKAWHKVGVYSVNVLSVLIFLPLPH